MECKSEKRIDRLEELTLALSGDLAQIKHDMTAIRRELVGSKDGITEGALPRINRKLDADDDRITRLEANGFSEKERERILHVVGLFEGWKAVIAVLVYLVPLVTLIVTLINKG